MTRSVPRLLVRTREIDPVEDLLAYADPHAPLVWLRRGDGMVAVSESPVVVELHVPGGEPAGDGTRAALLADAWRALAEAATVDDEVVLPGTGLIGFGALAFDEASAARSSILVPATIIGRRGGRSWLTQITIADADADAAPETDPEATPEVTVQPTPYGPYWSGTLGPGSLTPDGYQHAVAAGLAAISAGDVGKVVLARDLIGSVPADADLRRLARALSTGYPDTWTYAVDGIIGASPETLVTVAAGTVTARVLAGTSSRGADADADTAASLALATSAKDQDEHQYAVQSVLAALRPHTNSLAASEQPFMLKLPNVWHLATDVEGELSAAASSLDLVGVLHPTAAVAGTPTAAAVDAIRRIEPFDRARYAGPVGWIDAAGDGEWAIALRCAQFGEAEGDVLPLTAHAGAGIVSGSDPEAELLETRVKFRPIVDALA